MSLPDGPVYLDHNATSPLLPEVATAMEPWLGSPANPASVHRLGQAAAVAVERARHQVAALLDRDPAGIVFTSGATEANHHALWGLAQLGARTVGVSAIEHPCVEAAVDRSGLRPVPLSVGSEGRIDLTSATEPVDLWVCMAANHETGVVQDVDAAIARGPTHVDATQGAGRVPLTLGKARTVALSSHKLGGPGGMGALSLTDGGPFPAWLGGGSQERGRRAGTVYVAGVVGFGAACELAVSHLHARVARWRELTQRLDMALSALGARSVGSDPRLPNTRCVVFSGIAGESVVQGLDLAGIAVSSGAACASGSVEPSPVLAAMGDPEPDGAVRVSLGPGTTWADLDALLTALPPVLSAWR